jgi:hypothetical protein
MPVLCSTDAAAISPMMSLTRWIDYTISLTGSSATAR